MFHGMTKSKLKFYKSGFILYIFDIIFEFVSSYFEKKKLSLTKKIPTITENNYNIIEQKFRKTYKNLKTIRPNNIPHARRTLEVNNITSLNHSYNKSITVTSCTNGNDSRTVSAVRFYRKQNATRLKVDSYPRSLFYYISAIILILAKSLIFLLFILIHFILLSFTILSVSFSTSLMW